MQYIFQVDVLFIYQRLQMQLCSPATPQSQLCSAKLNDRKITRLENQPAGSYSPKTQQIVL